MSRPSKEKQYLIDKYKELVWALSLQGYTFADIAIIMNRDISVIKRICDQRPKGWTPKWRKIE